MLHKTKNILRKIKYSHAGNYVRSGLGIEQVPFKAINHKESISDLFPFILHHEYETVFDIMNISSMLRPDLKVSETVLLIFYDENGKKLPESELTLNPFETLSIKINNYVPKSVMYGSFAVIHSPTIPNLMAPHKTCISERGYLGFRKKGSLLWSYVHGNSYVIAGKHVQDSFKLRPFRNKSRQHHLYSPQSILNDCNKLQLVFVNQLNSKQTLTVICYNEDNSILDRRTYNMIPYQTILMSFDEKLPYRVASESKIYMFRPIIFKSYDSHFDVFHA